MSEARDPAREAWIDEARRVTSADALERLGFAGRFRTGAELAGACPACGGTDRFALVLRGRKAGVFNCRKCGAKGTDGIGVMMALRGLDFLKACEELAGPPPSGTQWTDAERAQWLEKRRAEETARAADRQRREAEEARRAEAERARLKALYDGARPLWAAEAQWGRDYLAARQLAVPALTRMRFIGCCAYWGEGNTGRMVRMASLPALITPFQRGDGRFAGVHLTYLDPVVAGEKVRMAGPDGTALPAKKMRGDKRGCVLQVVCHREPEALVLGEGIETVLSVYTAMVRAGREVGRTAFWAAGDLYNLGGPKPGDDAPAINVPDSVVDLLLLGDGDSDPGETRRRMDRAAQRYAREGRRVRVAYAPDGADFNDVLRGKA